MFTSDSKEDKVLLSRADDVVALSAIRNKPCYIGFLNEREAYILKDYLSWNSENISFFGGYDNATRTMMCCSNYDVENADFPIKSVCFKYRKFDVLNHRDFLGALMSLGIERNCIGDILVGEGCALCYVKSEVYNFIVSQINKIGKVGVIITDKCSINYKCRFDTLQFTISSMRLDVIVSAITGLSRAKTNTLILSGKVFINYCENKNFSYNLKQDDILTIRGQGKYVIKEIVGVTKKQRLKILIEQYR